MNKKSSKLLKFLLAGPILMASIVGCSSNQSNDNLKGKIIGDYVVELPTITNIDYEAGLKKNKEMFGKFGCSAIGKVLSSGDMVVGRSFDLYYSNNPAYIIKTNVEGFYKTVGLSYNTFDGKPFSEIKEKGVTQDELLTLLFFTEDVMNEKGLYIEANMRPEQQESTGIKPSTCTNPNAKVSLSFPALVRYLGERCATVTEAVEMANTLNVYGMITETQAWGGGYFMADQSGHYGVLELVDNKLIWSDYANCQCNFYINEEYKDKATNGAGLGRYDLLEENISSVNSESDMQNLIKKVRYTQMMNPYNSQFDPCSEICGFGKGYEDFGGAITLDMCRSGKYKDQILAIMEKMKAPERAKSVEQLKNEGKEWLSVWQTVANCNKKTVTVTFFEDDSLTYSYGI